MICEQEGLGNNCCVAGELPAGGATPNPPLTPHSSPLHLPRNWPVPGRQEVAHGSCVWKGRVGEAASRFVLDRHHGITVHGGGGVILMTLVLRHLGAVGTVGRSSGGTGPKGNFDQSLRSFFFFPFFFLMILLWHDRAEMKTFGLYSMQQGITKMFFLCSFVVVVFLFFCFVSDPAEA